MNKYHNEGFCYPHYLYALVQDNVTARNIFINGRIGLPPAKCIGILYNASIPLIKRRLPLLYDDIRIVRGSEVGAVMIAEFLNHAGREKQFFPVYTADDIMAEDGILRGLHLDDFYVALKRDQIVGVTACWNQLSFRRTLVTGYSRHMRWLKNMTTPFTSTLHMAPIPNSGEPLRSVSAACIAVEGNNRQIFELLLGSILHAAYNTGKTFLIVGLMETDPLISVIKRYLHIPSRTCIYLSSWDDFKILSKLDDRVHYVEMGSL